MTPAAQAILSKRVKNRLNNELRWLAQRELGTWKRHGFDELRELINQPQHVERRGASGTMYGIETMIVWNEKPGGAIRIMTSIDDGGIRAFCPTTFGAIVQPA